MAGIGRFTGEWERPTVCALSVVTIICSQYSLGPLLSLTVGPTTVVVINSFSKAKEILDKKGPIYSSRPYVAMAGGLMGWEKSTGLLVYGAAFKQTRSVILPINHFSLLRVLCRKLFHQELGSASAVKSFWPQEESQARKFLELCTDKPERLVDHCFQYAFS